MDQILDLAGKLGKRIAADRRAQALSSARKALDGDSEERQLLGDYEEQKRRIGELQAGGKPIEPDDKRKLQSLHERVVSSTLIKDLLASQADYIELMSQVSQKIEQEAFSASTDAAAE